MGANRLVARQQLVGTQQQLGKIDDALPLALRLVQGVDLRHATPEAVVCLDIARAKAFFLRAVDEALNVARRILLVIDPVRLEQALDCRELIRGIQDLKRLGQSGFAKVRAQQSVAKAMKRAHPHGTRVDRHDRADARHHFPGCLVGEGDRQDAQRAGIAGWDQPGDARGEHARFSAAGAGQHQRVARFKGYGLLLGRVELVDHAA